MSVLMRRDAIRRLRPKNMVMATAMLLAGALTLVSCQSDGLGSAGGPPPLATAATPANPTPNPNGEAFGTGSVRVSLLLPKTAPGNGAAVAQELRNGALLALQDFGQDTIQIVIKDTAGQAGGAQAAANEAVLEGSSAILGPVFSGSVSAASAIVETTEVSTSSVLVSGTP